MAFKDANGKITIDEVAAQKDIANIRSAIQDIQAARDSLREIMYQAQSFSGKTAISIEESSLQLIKEYDKTIQQLNETVTAITSTVDKYRKIDENLNLPNLCRTQIRITLDKTNSVNYFLTKPLGNHHLIFYSNNIKDLQAFLKNSGLKEIK